MHKTVGTFLRVAASTVILFLSSATSTITLHPHLTSAKSFAKAAKPAIAGRPVQTQRQFSGPYAPVATTGAVSGTVTAAADSAPIRAVVSVFTNRTSNNPIDQTVSDDNGRYVIPDLAPGTYYVRFSNYDNSNFLSEFYDDQPSQAQATPVTVTAGVTVPVNAALTAGGVITGRVTRDVDGGGIYFVLARLYTSTLQGAPLVDQAITDNNGYYTFRGLSAGTYYLFFNTFHVSAYLSEYYSDAASVNQATPITVTPGTTITANAGLATGGMITGALTSEDDGSPLAGGVYVYDSLTKTNYIAYASAYPANVYTVTGLPSGVYYVKAEPDYDLNYFPEFYADQATQAAATPVTISVNTTTTLNFALASGALITGRVVEDGTGIPVSDTVVSVQRSAANEYRSAITNADGYYTVTRLMGGGYTIYFDPESNHLPEEYDNKVQNGDVVTVAAKSTLPNINASLAVGGQILGRVTAADNSQSLNGVRVEVYRPQGEGYQRLGDTFYTDSAGYYTVTRLLSDTYRVGFFTGGGNSEPYLSEYYDGAGLLETAKTITVTAGSDVPNINATLERGGQIAGRVTADDSGNGLHLIYVSVYSGTELITRQSTNSNGEYTTNGVPAGNYTVRFEPHESWPTTEEYVGEWYSDTTQANATPVNVAVGVTTPNINASLLRGIHLTGTVQYASNTFAYIYLLDANNGDELKREFLSGSNNNFEFVGVGPGTYKIRYYGGAMDAAAQLRPSADYVNVYYNQKTSIEAADVITVSGSVNVGGVNAQILNNPANPRPFKVNLPLAVR